MAVITISLAYAGVDKQHYQELTIPADTTLYEALQLSGWFDLPHLSAFAEWCDEHANHDPNHKAWYVGIYSQKKRLDTVLCHGDRVEIYRPLSADPMAKRKSKSKARFKKLGYRPL